jgi:hypothetical protein
MIPTQARSASRHLLSTRMRLPRVCLGVSDLSRLHRLHCAVRSKRPTRAGRNRSPVCRNRSGWTQLQRIGRWPRGFPRDQGGTATGWLAGLPGGARDRRRLEAESRRMPRQVAVHGQRSARSWKMGSACSVPWSPRSSQAARMPEAPRRSVPRTLRSGSRGRPRRLRTTREPPAAPIERAGGRRPHALGHLVPAQLIQEKARKRVPCSNEKSRELRTVA